MRFGDEGVRLSPALVEALCRAHWPGNVRQVENAVARMVALRSASEIGVDAFGGDPDLPPSPEPCIELESAGPLSEQLEALERRIIARVMDAVAGNQSEAARRLGLNRGSLIGRLKKYGLAKPCVRFVAARSGSDTPTGALSALAIAEAAPWSDFSPLSEPTPAVDRPPDAPERSDSVCYLEGYVSSPDHHSIVVDC